MPDREGSTGAKVGAGNETDNYGVRLNFAYEDLKPKRLAVPQARESTILKGRLGLLGVIVVE